MRTLALAPCSALGSSEANLNCLETVTLHDLSNALQVWWTSGSQDRAGLAEELRTEDAGSYRNEHAHRIGATIHEVVRGTAWNEECLARSKRRLGTLDGEGACSVQYEHGFIVG